MQSNMCQVSIKAVIVDTNSQCLMINSAASADLEIHCLQRQAYLGSGGPGLSRG